MNEDNTLIEIQSESAHQTFLIGFAMGKQAREGDVFALSGELGAGKTCFTGGLARGLGVDEDYAITSPTFTMVNEYPGRCHLYHFDVYRLNRTAELDDLGYDEYISGNGVVVIEWAEKIVGALPFGTVTVKFKYVDENSRVISIEGSRKKLGDLLRDISRED